MPIRLRVVGILYNNVVNLSGGSTVQQVLDAAVKSPSPQASGFGYIPHRCARKDFREGL